MKFFSSLLTFGLLGSIASAAVLPPVENAVSSVVEKRTVEIGAIVAKVEALKAQVTVFTAKINETVAGVTKQAPFEDRLAKAVDVNDLVNGLTAQIKIAIIDIKSTASDTVGDVIPTAGPTDLAAVVAALLLEISATLNGVLTSLGLKAILSGTLGGLVASLSALLLALVPVVDNLLELVRRLLDGLLVGLSATLVGLLL